MLYYKQRVEHKLVTQTHLALVNYEKAFVRRNKLWSVMEISKHSRHLIKTAH